MGIRFDSAARKAIDHAMIEVERRGDPVLDTGHLLLGLLHGSTGLVPAALRRAGVEVERIRDLATASLAQLHGEPRASSGQIDVARATEQILQRSSELSAERGSDCVSDLDILMAAAERPETVAGQVLGARMSARVSSGGEQSRPDSGGGREAPSPGRVTTEREQPAGAGQRSHQSPRLTRTGIGYDSHRFAAGGPLILGGIRIEAAVHLAGHSDGDAIAHALTDAVLGASGGGDIGEMFADTDPANRGRDSIGMLRHAVDRARGLGWTVEHVDVVVVAETPRIGPHRQAMREVIAPALGIDASAVSIKGKTNEGMGWVGRGEGIACMAVATLVGPRRSA